ncbi:putative beta-glucosidase [Metarhizium anisopliae BRIP 53293]|uniref:beta-glucosidase n=1 Tax=Metarhizium anisopliae BRIP 53293 TaxID=1291518 RepID=A0A0D9NQ02_METAN|nr:putative beta-glucosidase [Metarhizium anisopliae BRIP 53293]KJK92020.1 putative beta-glucosidase [Metarhizium anisopliae BRIP 53284]
MADINIEEVLKKLTLAEKVDLLTGADFWHTKALPKHGIPSLRMSDGPNGVRGTKFFNGVPAACFPCGTALGSTFNQQLLEEAGKKMGEEALAKSAHIILGPTINMQRSPLGGRGFESIGEDPFLAGLGAAALVRGIQSTGVQATIKHFLCNDQEDKRMGVQSIVTERALREIYALPFQLAVRDARPGAFMTAYNGINGTMCSENSKYLDRMLRKEWGWEGLIMSDWYGTYSTTPAVVAGLDLEMPGPARFRGEALKFNASTNKPFTHVIDERVRAVLRLVKKVSGLDIKELGPEREANTPETAALLRKIGNESIVLLKNDNNVLPFKKDKKTLVLGPNAKVATYHGGGSASLPAYYAVTPYDGIAAKLGSCPAYTVGAYTHRFLPLLGSQCIDPNGKQGMRWTVYNEPPGTPDRQSVDMLYFSKTDMHLLDYNNPKVADTWYADLEGSFVPDEDCTYELGLVVSGTAKAFVNNKLIVDNATKQVAGDTFFGAATREERGFVDLKKGEKYEFRIEFGSAPTFTLKGDASVPGHGSLRVGGSKVIDDQEEIKKSVQLAKEYDQVIICAGLNSDWETEGADRVSMKLPGVLDQLITQVAAANSNTAVVMQTGTPEEMPWLEKTPAVVQAWYGGNETGNCIADILFGDANPSGKLSLSFPKQLQDVPSFLNFRAEAGRTLYGEDVYMGYRYYEFANRAVNFPFGHGLSYTSFSFSDLSVTSSEGKVTAALKVKNTGSTKGSEVAQMYIKPRQAAKIRRPVKELRGFAKVELEAGETKMVTITELEKYVAAYWDEERDQWCVEAGEYEVIISDSSVVRDGKAVRGSFKVSASYWWDGI